MTNTNQQDEVRALTNENIIATTLRMVLDDIGLACAAVASETGDLSGPRAAGAHECLRRVAAIRERVLVEAVDESCGAPIATGTGAPSHDYDHSFDRLRDVIDEEFGMQPLMSPAEMMTFLERRFYETRAERQKVAIAESDRDGLADVPIVDDFWAGVRAEKDHQLCRWGTTHDRNKAPADWFWLVGYLAGKALASHVKGDIEKALHHTISSAAVLAHWHDALGGAGESLKVEHDPSRASDIEKHLGIEPTEEGKSP